MVERALRLSEPQGINYTEGTDMVLWGGAGWKLGDKRGRFNWRKR